MKLISKSSTTQRIIALAVLFAMVIGLVPFNSMSVSAAAPFPNGKEPMKYGDELTLTDDGVLSEADKAKFVEIAGSSRPTYPAFGPYTHGGCYDTKGNSSTETRCQNCDAPFSYKIAANGEWYYLGVNDNSNWTDWTTKGNGAVLEKGSTLATGDGSFKAANANKSAVYFFSSNASDEEYIYFYVTKNVTFDVRWESESGYAHCNINGPGIYRVRTVAKNGKFNDIWLGAPSIIHTHDMTYEVVKTVAVKDVKGEYTDHKDSVNAMTGDTVQYKVEVTATCENCDLTLQEAQTAGLLDVYLNDEYLPALVKEAGRAQVINWNPVPNTTGKFIGVYTYEYEITGNEPEDEATSFTNVVTAYDANEDDNQLCEPDEAVVNIVTDPVHEHVLEYDVVKEADIKTFVNTGADQDVTYTVTVTAECDDDDCDAAAGDVVDTYLEDDCIPNKDKESGSDRAKVKLTWNSSTGKFTGQHTYTYTITIDDIKNKLTTGSDGKSYFPNEVYVYSDKEEGEPEADAEAKVYVTEPDPEKVSVTIKKAFVANTGIITEADNDMIFNVQLNKTDYYVSETDPRTGLKLEPGKYSPEEILTETQLALGYSFDRIEVTGGASYNTATKEITISEGTTEVTITVYNDIASDGKVTVKKQVFDRSEQQLEDDGTGFDVVLYKVVDGEEDEFVERGTISANDDPNDPLTFSNLRYGTYKVVEENNNDDYKIVYGEKMVVLSPGNADQEVTLINQKIKGYDGEIYIQKTAVREVWDAPETTEPPSGTEEESVAYEPIDGIFTLQLIRTDIENPELYGEYEVVVIDGTSEPIFIEFDNLPDGEYILAEKQGDVNYEFDYSPKSITIANGRASDTGFDASNVEKEEHPGKIEVEKIFDGDDDDVDGYEFTFVLYLDGEELGGKSITLKAGEKGTFDNLPAGNYTIKEVFPVGKGYAFEPVDDVDVPLASEEELQIPITNSFKRTQDLVIRKVLNRVESFYEEDFTFEVYEAGEEGESVATRIIKGEGTADSIEKLPAGNYIVKEVLERYSLYLPLGGLAEIDVTISEGSEDEIVTFTNVLQATGLEVVKVLISPEPPEDGSIAEVVAGTMMEIAVTVTNRGDVTLYNIDVYDYIAELVDEDYVYREEFIDIIDELEAGKSEMFTVYIKAPAAGQTHKDYIVATGYTDPDDTEEPEDPEKKVEGKSEEVVVEVVAPAAGSLSITKLVNNTATSSDAPLSVTTGSELTFTFIVRNTGNVDLTDIVVTDTTFGVLTDDEFDGSLAAGASYPFTRTLDAPAAGVLHSNVVTAVGSYEDDEGVTHQTEEVTDDAYARTPVTTTIDDIRIRDSSGTYSDITSGGTTETTSGETPSETVEPNYVPTGTPDVYQLMDEDDTPLGYFTPVLREDGNPDNPEDYDWVEVDEDGTPLGIVDIPKDNPKTNDNSFNKIRYIALIASACLALACVVITRKRRATSTNR